MTADSYGLLELRLNGLGILGRGWTRLVNSTVHACSWTRLSETPSRGSTQAVSALLFVGWLG